MSSVWDALRAQHNEVAEDCDPLYLDDPMHAGVVYRYRWVPAQDLKPQVKRLAKVKEPIDLQLAVAIEQLVGSLEAVMVMAQDGHVPKGKDGSDLYPEPLKELAEEGDPPITFEERLCDGMQFPEKTRTHVRKIVRAMFKGNDYALKKHADEVAEWTAEVGTAKRDEFSEEIAGGH